MPGNQVLPFGDLATIGFFVAMAVAVHRGNLFRTLISGVIIMSITLWIATQTIGLHTQLAANAGALKAGGMVASMDQGGSPITWLLIQVFSPQNIPGFIIIGAIYLTGIFMTGVERVALLNKRKPFSQNNFYLRGRLSPLTIRSFYEISGE